MVSSAARLAVRAAAATAMGAKTEGIRLADCVPRELVDDIFAHALKKQTGVSLKYMLDFGSNPIERQLVLSSQFLHKELPVRLAHRVAELENLPYGLSSKSAILKVSRQQQQQQQLGGTLAESKHSVSTASLHAPAWALPACHPAQPLIGQAKASTYTAGIRHICACAAAAADPASALRLAPVQVRDWYVESFNELRSFPRIQVSSSHTVILQHKLPSAAAARHCSSTGSCCSQQVAQDALCCQVVLAALCCTVLCVHAHGFCVMCVTGCQ
jgi:hypothetical protein